MAQTNRMRIDKGLSMLREGLTPFVERQLAARLGGDWFAEVNRHRRHPLKQAKGGKVQWDNAALLEVMLDHWTEGFSDILGTIHKSMVHELKAVRNLHAHEESHAFTYDETIRALGTMRMLLEAISAAEQAREVQRFEEEALRVKFTEKARVEERKQTSMPLEGEPDTAMQPWREIIVPHPDVASGRFTQAEFAADLDQVARGDGDIEYRDPVEFFRRTYITEGLRELLVNALRRLAGDSGDPVVQLQTNFGGGKTHSMLALYHLCGTRKLSDLIGVEEIMRAEGLQPLPDVRRAVLVGTALPPGQARTKSDGTTVHTLWGELAWQLGGKKAYKLLADSDKNGTSPGKQILLELFRAHSPCLILIDEWVAFARQLYHVSDLPAGSFDANLTFAQALTEAAGAAKNVLLVASLPASRIEIGGTGGEAALERLKTAFQRLQTSWKPATSEEAFEIVRRRLFEPIPVDKQTARDVVLRAFERMYASNPGDYPSGAGEAEYRRRMERAYPIHPVLFDDLYEKWSTLDRFQRTRGVLRLMAAVIHVLWERQDRHVLIFPSSVPLDEASVRDELTAYLEDRWDPIITQDVDGPSARSLQIDRENAGTYGRYSAARRVARSIFMGTAPTANAAHTGIDARRIKLGCVQPGESAATFGDALRRLSNEAMFLYSDPSQYWFNTQATVNRLADDRAAAYEEADVDAELVKVLKEDRQRGEFAGVHIAPESGAEVPDEMECRLVILGPQSPHERKSETSAARHAVEDLLRMRGSSSRLFQNMLVFLAPDAKKLSDLRDAMRRQMAWQSIVDDTEKLNLTSFSAKQASGKLVEARRAVKAQIPDVWMWCLIPTQADMRGPISWAEIRMTGDQPLAIRASKHLENQEQMLTRLGPARLGLELTNKLWRDLSHINTRKLWEYFASYVYLPRLRDQQVLVGAIESGIASTVASEHFGYADRYDDAQQRYVGLRSSGGGVAVMDSLSVLVRPDVARKHEYPAEPDVPGDGAASEGTRRAPTDGRSGAPAAPPQVKARRFHGSVVLDSDRVGRDAGRIAEEVIQHLQSQPGARVRVTLEIAADLPDGVDETTIRNVSENCRTLKFESQGFESE